MQWCPSALSMYRYQHSNTITFTPKSKRHSIDSLHTKVCHRTKISMPDDWRWLSALKRIQCYRTINSRRYWILFIWIEFIDSSIKFRWKIIIKMLLISVYFDDQGKGSGQKIYAWVQIDHNFECPMQQIDYFPLEHQIPSILVMFCFHVRLPLINSHLCNSIRGKTITLI